MPKKPDLFDIDDPIFGYNMNTGTGDDQFYSSTRYYNQQNKALDEEGVGDIRTRNTKRLQSLQKTFNDQLLQEV